MALTPVSKKAGIKRRPNGRFQAVVILNDKEFLADCIRNTLGEAREDLRRLKADLLYDLIPGKEG